MSILETKQTDILLSKAQENNFDKPQNIIDILTKTLAKSDFRFNPSFGKPLAPFYKASPKTLINKERIKDFFTFCRYDLLAVQLTIEHLENELANKLLEFQTTASKQESALKAIVQQANTSKRRQDLGLDWYFTESFTDLNYTNQTNTTAWIDTLEGLVSLPANVTQVQPTEVLQNIIQVNTYNTGVENIFDNDTKTAWYGNFLNPNSILSCDFKLDYSVNQVHIDPVGTNTAVMLEQYDGNSWVVKLNEVLLKGTTYNLTLVPNTKTRLTIRSAKTDSNSSAGLRSLKFFAKTFTEAAVFYSTSITPIFGYSEILFNSNENIPEGASLDHYWSSDSIVWTKLVKNTWNKVLDTISIYKQISIPSLSSLGVLYQSEVLAGTATSNKKGELLVGVDQLEITAAKNADISSTDLAPIPNEHMLNTNKKNTVWYTPSVAINSQVTGQTVSVQLVDYDSAPHASFVRGATLISQQDIGEKYNAITLLPIYGTPENQALQPHYVYKFSCHFYSTEALSVDNAKAWFLQGFRTPSSKTFKQLNRTYGTYALYLNDVLVDGSNQPHTIYTDNTAESGASAGNSYSFYIRKGWNKYVLYVYCPETLLTQSDPNTSTRMLQLTLYPNIFDPNFRTDYKITQIIGSGPQSPTNDFDLTWHLPKSFKYWAWKSFGTPNRVLFNVQDIEPLDGFVGLNNSSLYRPNLILNTDVKATDGTLGLNNSSNIYIKSSFRANNSLSKTPLLFDYQLYTR